MCTFIINGRHSALLELLLGRVSADIPLISHSGSAPKQSSPTRLMSKYAGSNVAASSGNLLARYAFINTLTRTYAPKHTTIPLVSRSGFAPKQSSLMSE